MREGHHCPQVLLQVSEASSAGYFVVPPRRHETRRRVTLPQLAKILGYARDTLLRACKRGDIVPLKNYNKGIRRWYYFDLDDPKIQELIANRHDPASDLRRLRRAKR